MLPSTAAPPVKKTTFMAFHLKMKKTSGLQTSPWIILGSTAILLAVVLAIANTNREKRYMAQVLKVKGAALIQAVEAGARTGMAAMMWCGQEVQRLLEETARLPDVLFMAVVDLDGRVVAHSDKTRIGTPFRKEPPWMRRTATRAKPRDAWESPARRCTTS